MVNEPNFPKLSSLSPLKVRTDACLICTVSPATGKLVCSPQSAISGLKRCRALGHKTFFLTLTSSPKTNHQDLRKDWDILVKRIRKLFPKFQYMKVETFEGYGVVHALYHHAFEDWNYSSIHAWFSSAWLGIHQEPIVWNSVVGVEYSIKKVSAICVNI